MLDETIKSLDEQTLPLMGINLHVSGEVWPPLPLCGVGRDGYPYIRWNNNDCVSGLGDPQQGDEWMETVEYWHPSSSIEQAMRLWSAYPPERHWVQAQVGKDGWTVELLYHHEKVMYLKSQIADNSMAKAITKAWIIAKEAV